MYHMDPVIDQSAFPETDDARIVGFEVIPYRYISALLFFYNQLMLFFYFSSLCVTEKFLQSRRVKLSDLINLSLIVEL